MSTQSDSGMPTGFSLGHYAGRDGNVFAYHSQRLPNRPTTGDETHAVICNYCQQPIKVIIMDDRMRRTRRAVKVVFGLLVALFGVIMAVQTASTPSDPATFEQPGYVVWAVWAWVGVVFAGICMLAFGVHETGVRLRIPSGSAASRGVFGHKVVR